MKWEKEDIVEYLINDYCTHFNKYHHFQDNDDEVDANWESAVCDYIFDLLQKITEGSPTDVADMIDNVLEGVFEFDPQSDPALLKPYVGRSFYAAQDIYYCSYSDLLSTYDEDDATFLLQEVFGVDQFENEDRVYIPKGTKMTLISTGQNDASGWPVFEIHGFEFDFAGDAFKLKPCKEE